MDISFPGGTDVTTAKYAITDIDRFVVTMNITYWFENNTRAGTFNIWGNLSNGDCGPWTGTTFPMSWLLLAADLGAYAPLYMNCEAWINETIPMNSFFVQGRATNHIKAVGPIAADVMAFDLCWDQTTGMTVRGNITGLIGPNSGLHQIWNLTSTSLWSPSAPTIDSPNDVTYEYGATGNSITWHPASQIPCNYTVTRNGTTIHCTCWTGDNITRNVDGLDVGTYIYACVVNDTLGREVSDSVTVTVTAAQAGQPFPVEVLILVGGGIAAVAVVAGIIMLRKRSS